MNKTKIVIIGGGGHAKVLINIINKSASYEIIGYLDKIDRGVLNQINYLGDDSFLEEIFYSGKAKNAAIGIGKTHLPDNRKHIFENLLKIGYELPQIISPSAVINNHVTIGKGSVIFDNVIVNSSAKIGNAVILNTASVIEHDSLIGNFSHIAPGAIVCGDCEIGENTFLGAGSVVIQGIKIISNCTIGAGSVVINNITEPGVYAGNPVRKIK